MFTDSVGISPKFAKIGIVSGVAQHGVKRLAQAVVVASSLTSSLIACQSGDGAFVGTQVDSSRGVTCSLCKPDIVPTAVDCGAAEEGVEFLPVTIWDFNETQASNLYTYNDGSMLSTLTQPVDRTWQPSTTPVSRCIGGDPADRALHYAAGPFTNWGGAFGRHLKCLNGSSIHGEIDGKNQPSTIGCDASDPVEACASEPGPDATQEELLAWSACPKRDKAMVHASVGDPDELTSDDYDSSQEYLLGMTLDFSEWDGISFWARRSYDSQPGFRVSLGDKYTDDDLSFLQYHINPNDKRACERNVECGCSGNSSCANAQGTGQCSDLPEQLQRDPLDDSKYVLAPIVCGNIKCQDGADPAPFEAFGIPDQQREGTTCRNYTFRGGIEGLYCYSDGRPPVENSELCGDHWTYSVYLSTEWKFYKVPFTSLLQQGWAKKFDKLDLKNAAVLRFNWNTGWVDFWLDDVRVYRDKHNTGRL